MFAAGHEADAAAASAQESRMACPIFPQLHSRDATLRTVCQGAWNELVGAHNTVQVTHPYWRKYRANLVVEAEDELQSCSRSRLVPETTIRDSDRQWDPDIRVAYNELLLILMKIGFWKDNWDIIHLRGKPHRDNIQMEKAMLLFGIQESEINTHVFI